MASKTLCNLSVLTVTSPFQVLRYWAGLGPPGKAACCPCRRHWPGTIPFKYRADINCTVNRAHWHHFNPWPALALSRANSRSGAGDGSGAHVLCQRVGAGLVAGPLNKALLFVASKLSTTPVQARQNTLIHFVNA